MTSPPPTQEHDLVAELRAAAERCLAYASEGGREVPPLERPVPGVDHLAQFRITPRGGQAGRH